MIDKAPDASSKNVDHSSSHDSATLPCDIPRDSGDSSHEVEAAAAWSIMTEPGDFVAETLRSLCGNVAAFQLIAAGAQAADLLAVTEAAGAPLTSRQAAAALRRYHARLAQHSVAAVIDRAEACGIAIVYPGHEQWPTALDRLGMDKPAALWVRGRADIAEMSARSVSMVGSRVPSQYGSDIAFDWGFTLAERGYVVTSGGALGIDGYAHRGALRGGEDFADVTMAVVASGVDVPTPSSHRRLFDQIVESGAIVSEYPPGLAAARHRFLKRNRLVAGLSQGVVVVEARSRSGALSTANWAAGAGIPLGAVPGNVTSPLSFGAHRIIREVDATLVTCVDDVVELAGLNADDDTVSVLARLGPVEQRVYAALYAGGARTVRSLGGECSLSHSDTVGALGMLDLAGLAEQVTVHGEQHWQLVG